APGRIQIAKPGTPNDAAGFPIDYGQSASGLDASVEESPKYFTLVAVAFRMVFPNQGITCRCEECLEVIWTQWPQINQMAVQRRLKIKINFHCDVVKEAIKRQAQFQEVSGRWR